MTTYIVGSFKYGSRHRSITTARKAAYELVGKPRMNSLGTATIVKLNAYGKLERWSEGLVSRMDLEPVIYTKYDKDKIVGRWILNKDGSLGKKQ